MRTQRNNKIQLKNNMHNKKIIKMAIENNIYKEKNEKVMLLCPL